MKKFLQTIPLVILMCFCLSAFFVQATDTKSEALTLKVTPAGSGIQLSWNGDKNTAYSVYKKTGSGKYINTASVKGRKFTDKNVSGGEKYSYCIRKTKDIKSNKVSVIYLEAPVIKKSKSSEKGVSLSWSAVKGAEKYIVYRRSGKGGFEKIGSTSELSFIDSAAKENTKYIYTLKSYADGSYSVKAPEVSVIHLVSPDIISVERKNNGLEVSWKKSEGNVSYVIYRRENEKDSWQKIASVSSSSLTYKDTAVTAGKTYTYAVNVIAYKKESSFTGTYMSEKHLPSPLKFTMNQDFKTVKLSWEKADNATEYELYRKVSDKKWEKHQVLSASDTQFTETLKNTNKKVSYKLRAVTKEGKSGFTKTLTIRYIDPKKPMVALTYDDGPHPVHTHTILDVLEKYDARATFFVVGCRIKPYKDCLERQNSLGCEIANHSYSHVSLSSSPDKTVKSQVSKTDKLIKKYSSQTPSLIRAPGGSIGKALKLVDKPFIQWSVDTRDWECLSSSKVVSHIKRTVRDGSIVLMHDLYGSTANATKEIVPWLIKKGYQLVTLSELMEAKGIKLTEGKVYYNGYS